MSDDFDIVLRLDCTMAHTLKRLLRDEIFRHDGDHNSKPQQFYREARNLEDALNKSLKEAWQCRTT